LRSRRLSNWRSCDRNRRRLGGRSWRRSRLWSVGGLILWGVNRLLLSILPGRRLQFSGFSLCLPPLIIGGGFVPGDRGRVYSDVTQRHKGVTG
jgi:hypothetical protein